MKSDGRVWTASIPCRPSLRLLLGLDFNLLRQLSFRLLIAMSSLQPFNPSVCLFDLPLLLSDLGPAPFRRLIAMSSLTPSTSSRICLVEIPLCVAVGVVALVPPQLVLALAGGYLFRKFKVLPAPNPSGSP